MIFKKEISKIIVPGFLESVNILFSFDYFQCKKGVIKMFGVCVYAFINIVTFKNYYYYKKGIFEFVSILF